MDPRVGVIAGGEQYQVTLLSSEQKVHNLLELMRCKHELHRWVM
jgi:hypothetical protein